MTALLIVAAVAVAVVAIAPSLLNRRRNPSPVHTGTELPRHVERSDFVSPSAPWLIAVFSAKSCMACAGVIEWTRSLESSTVAVQDLEVGDQKELHTRYRIGSVPSTLAVDAHGVVRYDVVGPLSADDKDALAALVAHEQEHAE